jgi:hypothetical protein
VASKTPPLTNRVEGARDQPEIGATVSTSELCESTGSGTEEEPSTKRVRGRSSKSHQRTIKGRPGPSKAAINFCAQSGIGGVAAVADALASRPIQLKTYGSSTRSQHQANTTVSSSDLSESGLDTEEEPCAKRARGRLPRSINLQRALKARDARIAKLDLRIKALQLANQQLQRKLDTRPPTALGNALRCLTKTKKSNDDLRQELHVATDALAVQKTAKVAAQGLARVRKHRKAKKVDAQRKLIRSLQRNQRRSHTHTDIHMYAQMTGVYTLFLRGDLVHTPSANHRYKATNVTKSKKKTKKRSRKKVVGEAALRKREKAMARLVGEQFDDLCEEFDVGNRRLGLVMTRDGGSATIVSEPVTVPDDTGLDHWDPISDRLLGKAVFIVDDKTIPVASYRATQSLSSGVAPNAHRVGKGKEALDIAIEALGVSIDKVGLGEHKHDSPAVVTTVSGLLEALDTSQMYPPSHTHTHTRTRT